MDLSGHRILAYLEEDNTQRTLFRVRPCFFPRAFYPGRTSRPTGTTAIYGSPRTARSSTILKSA